MMGMTTGKYARLAYLADYELDMGNWWRSENTIDGLNPYGGYLTSKYWAFNEVQVFHSQS